MRKISILVADDQMLTREGLCTILNLEEDMRVIGTAKNGEEAYTRAEALHPDCVLLDIRMPKMDGISALKRIKQSCPDVHVLILTTFIDEEYIVECMAHGASGYLLKDMDLDKLIASIRDTVDGQSILPAAVSAMLALKMKSITEGNEQEQAFEEWNSVQLSEREAELAQFIMRGMNNREIAAVLHIAEGTARNYISKLYTKLDVTDRAQAIVRLQTLIGIME